MRQAKFEKSLTIAINSIIFERVRELAKIKQISIGEWVRSVIETALNSKRDNGSVPKNKEE